MIKLKLSDPSNMKCFGALLIAKDILPNYSMQLTDSNDYDYELIDINQWMYRGRTLEESIEYGVNALANKSGDYFMMHGGGGTDIIGAYEVLKESNAIALLKKSIWKYVNDL